MAIVNFSVPTRLVTRVNQIVKKNGFASKAEFFRFAALYFMDLADRPPRDEDRHFVHLTSAIEQEVKKKLHGKSLPSLREQLANL